MSESLADQVLQKISEAGELYYHLILVVGPAGSVNKDTFCLRGIGDTDVDTASSFTAYLEEGA